MQSIPHSKIFEQYISIHFFKIPNDDICSELSCLNFGPSGEVCTSSVGFGALGKLLFIFTQFLLILILIFFIDGTPCFTYGLNEGVK
jgi:hypothetical protein